MARKAIAVAQAIEWANTRLATPSSSMRWDSPAEERAFRQGIASFAEQILHGTGNYHGFNYQESELLPEEERDYDKGTVLRPDYDDTRKIYFS
jgi:hypothetical protein